jgi:hypothetical protein
MRPPREDTQPWYKQFWPWFLISIPAGTIIAAIVTINLAIETSDGLVKDDYYKEGLAIHKDAARVKSAQDLGITAQLQHDNASGRVEVQLSDAAIGDVERLALTLFHPTRDNHDQRILLTRLTQGVYAGEMAALVPANWRVTLTPPAGEWRVAGRLAIPQSNSAVLQ